MNKEDQRKLIINNYLKLLEANKNYIEYLESFGEVNNITDENIDLLKISYVAFALLLWKDEFIIKDENKKISTSSVDKILDEHLKLITTKTVDNKWKLGSVELDSSPEVLDKIRNKLAHGDYEIKNKHILIEINSKQIAISIEQLVSLAISISNNWETMQKTKENTRGILRNNNALENIYIVNEKDLDKALNNISYIEIKDKPKILRMRNEQYIQLIKSITDLVTKLIYAQKEVESLPNLPKNKKLLEDAGMDLKITETKVIDLDSSKKAKQMYLKNINYLRTISPMYQQKYLAFWLHEAQKKEMHKKSLSFGLTNNQAILKELEKNSNQNLIEIIENNKFASLLAIQNQKTLLSAYLTSFYITYIYALDNILNIKDKEDIRDIVDNKVFNFARLDLSNIKSITIDEKDYKEFLDQINKISTDIEELTIRVEKINKNLNSIREAIDTGNKSKEKVFFELKKVEEKILAEIERLKHQKEKCELFMSTEYQNYKKNRAIIEHIRNSIAHGNISIDIFTGNYTLDDAIITLKDEYMGKNTFELNISLKDFNCFFEEKNINEILNYINHTKEKGLTK